MMPVPSDGFPTNLSPLALRLREEFTARPQNVALVVLRRRGCACPVGAVYRLPSGDLLMGRRRGLVQRTPTAAEARHQYVCLALAEIEEIVLVSQLSCRHAGHLALPVPELRAALDAAAVGQRRTNTPLLL
jgi:hypothetical protein